MARTFRRQRHMAPIAELNVTNLIDLGFLLLIIFMITTSSSRQEQTIPVTLPVESRSVQPRIDSSLRFISVAIDARGQYYLDDRPVSLEELRARLRDYAAQPKPPVVRIRGDGQVEYGRIIALMDELKQADLRQVTFDTQIKP